MGMQDLLLSIPDVQERLARLTGRRPAASTVRRWVAVGLRQRTLPAFKLLGELRFRSHDVDDFLGVPDPAVSERSDQAHRVDLRQEPDTGGGS